VKRCYKTLETNQATKTQHPAAIPISGSKLAGRLTEFASEAWSFHAGIASET
jgi:hypothetical protein